MFDDVPDSPVERIPLCQHIIKTCVEGGIGTGVGVVDGAFHHVADFVLHGLNLSRVDRTAADQAVGVDADRVTRSGFEVLGFESVAHRVRH